MVSAAGTEVLGAVQSDPERPVPDQSCKERTANASTPEYVITTPPYAAVTAEQRFITEHSSVAAV